MMNLLVLLMTVKGEESNISSTTTPAKARHASLERETCEGWLRLRNDTEAPATTLLRLNNPVLHPVKAEGSTAPSTTHLVEARNASLERETCREWLELEKIRFKTKKQQSQ